MAINETEMQFRQARIQLQIAQNSSSSLLRVNQRAPLFKNLSRFPPDKEARAISDNN